MGPGEGEAEKSEEELTQLLNKIEKSIVDSINRGIEIADNFPGTSISNPEQDLTEVVSPSICFEEGRWEFLNPTVLYKDNWMGARTEGINLDKGTYRIVFQVSGTTPKGSGLAFFDEKTRKVQTLLFWQAGVGNTEKVINTGGTQVLSVKSPGIINITDISGKFNPKEGEAIYIVTVFRRNKLPD